MSFAKIRGELTTRVGRWVRYGAPQDVQGKGGNSSEGTIIDEVWVDLESVPHEQPCDEHCWGDYSFCSQLIEWSDGSRSVRLAYYRRRCGENAWEYASQMTVSSNPATIHSLLTCTLAKADWFADGASN
jgi:hypothetical protein